MKFFERRRRQDRLIVIGAILGQGELTSHELSKRTGLSPGRLYPALVALETAGRISSRWQDGPYPRRRLYRYAWRKGGVVRTYREGM